MSHSEGKAEIQVSHPGQAFPFASLAAPPHPHINQWCRFSIPERLPLKPFRQDRLAPLPLPPAVMATSKVTSTTGAGNLSSSTSVTEQHNGDIDPFQKIQQLEKNLAFVRENHASMLKGLHDEIAELKQKNKELLFEIVTGVPLLPKDISEEHENRDSSEEKQDKIEKLEKEVRKLRNALKDAMKANSSLSNQLQELKREQYSRHSSHRKVDAETPSDSAIDDEQPGHSPCGPSPQMEEYSDTLRQIQRATTQRSGRRDDRRYRNDEGRNDWSDNYTRNNNGYQHHRHHHHHRNQQQKSAQHQEQPRLPRLPLRNQQNYSQPQYEIQYRQRSTNTLPALKPLVPVVDHRFDKPRKPRGPRPPKIADQSY
ncbi:CCDC92 domain-containing protein [Caerostris darwini]|uniref:CCDC92 domain-containing protein n=1 Tax=Caerostris darwini TaxID=1538125 RepID=A0AAV4S2P8_9ARAC|nr:CCDC92 domain-containing protein [Caerostris darwini]